MAGWAFHFWNGASFGLIYVLVFGTCRRWMGAIFGLLLGFGFMFSPVVSALGVGFMGLEFSKGFPVTVTLAHAAFGSVLGWLASEWMGFLESPLFSAFRRWVPTAVSRRPLAGQLHGSEPIWSSRIGIICGSCFNTADGSKTDRGKTYRTASPCERSRSGQ